MKKGRLAAGIFILCLQSIAGTQWNIAGEQKAYGAELFAVSYTHLDVYKRQGYRLEVDQ